ncbi:MAG: phage holin family protein [Chloroflexaceae bacterium]|nr:phage holin family protein [Chloroflexaceae bacterium]
MDLIIQWLVTAVVLFVISRLNIGIGIDGFGNALLAAVVIGLINAIIRPIFQVLALPLTFLTLGLFAFVVNALCFWLAAAILPGFWLKHGFWSALLGSLLMTITNMLISAAFGVTIFA